MAEKITMKDMLANLPQKTDVDTVVGRDASGNPVYIKKSDLAQVVAGLIGTIANNSTSWHKIVDISSKYSSVTIFGSSYTYQNQASAFLHIFCGIYSDGKGLINIEKLSKTSINNNYGVKVKYKKEDGHIQVWLYGSFNFITSRKLNIVDEEPDEDAIDVNLNA